MKKLCVFLVILIVAVLGVYVYDHKYGSYGDDRSVPEKVLGKLDYHIGDAARYFYKQIVSEKSSDDAEEEDFDVLDGDYVDGTGIYGGGYCDDGNERDIPDAEPICVTDHNDNARHSFEYSFASGEDIESRKVGIEGVAFHVLHDMTSEDVQPHISYADIQNVCHIEIRENVKRASAQGDTFSIFYCDAEGEVLASFVGLSGGRDRSDNEYFTFYMFGPHGKAHVGGSEGVMTLEQMQEYTRVDLDVFFGRAITPEQAREIAGVLVDPNADVHHALMASAQGVVFHPLWTIYALPRKNTPGEFVYVDEDTGELFTQEELDRSMMASIDWTTSDAMLARDQESVADVVREFED